MSSKKPSPRSPQPPLDADRLRWRCDPARFSFEKTDDLESCPIRIIGQPRAVEALELGLANREDGYNIYVCGRVGSGRSTVVRRILAALDKSGDPPPDIVFVHNFEDPDRPCRIIFPAGHGRRFGELMAELIESLGRELPRLFESEEYRHLRAARIDEVSSKQKARLKEFESRAQVQGFTLVQVQTGPFMRSQLAPIVAGNPLDMDQVEALVDQGQFNREEYEKLVYNFTGLKTELEGLSKEMRDLDRNLRRELRELDRGLARPLVAEAVGELREMFPVDKLDAYLSCVESDVLRHLDRFRDTEDPTEPEDGSKATPPPVRQPRYAVNVVVDNTPTVGQPVIWERTPTHRNLFGTIERTGSETEEPDAAHTRIKAGSLLRANGGFLVLDALDLMVDPGVWATLKRTLRHRELEIQTFDPMHMMIGSSSTPEPVPIDVKVLVIGTQRIYGILFALDEDFRKVFKIKAEFSEVTPLNDDELMNYACLIHNRCKDDGLQPFHRDAVATVVEHGVRLAGNHDKLTTRFSLVTDLVRESGYWARKNGAKVVRAEHVDEALRRKRRRVDLIEETMRERITDGTVLLDLEGRKIAQVNGLAVLDVGDHAFGHPTRITATTAVGRAGIIDIDRESNMSGSIHTKGVLILTGFLRSRFAQSRPLSLTASLTFEQSYGGIDGDSASCAELYALLSSLAEVPIRQGIAVTGSVNQRGEVQPIGGVNEKIEGYFDLCSLAGLNGEQGVLIPARNLPQLMLRKDLVETVRQGRFNIWAAETIDEGLEILTGRPAGVPDRDGALPADSIFGRVDARLGRMAEELVRFGPGDVPPR